MENPYGAGSHIPPARLQGLLTTDPLAQPRVWQPHNLDIDYLADMGMELEKALNADDAARNRFGDALGWFLQTEKDGEELIRNIWAKSRI